MKIATLVKGTGADFEQRKLQLARRDMDQAYKKNAKYANAAKNPMLLALENLLSGKTEKELHERDLATKQQEVFENHLPREEKLQLPEVKQEIKELVSTSYEGTVHEQSHTVANASFTDAITYTNVQNGQKYAIGQEEVIKAPSIDFLQETIDESFDVKIPERFLTNVERNAEKETIFGKELEKLLFNRTFNKAKMVYTNHIEMVKNSYHSYNEPLFSRTA